MGTVRFPALETVLIEPSSGSLSINEASFPLSDSTPRATASFGDTGSFVSRSSRQEVTTSTAIIGIGISIVGVNFNGPVTLTFADNEVNLNDIYIVDEGGFCNSSNTITATSTSASGGLVLSNAYNYMKARTNGTEWFSEVATTIIVPENGSTTENSDGSTTVVDPDGTSVTTSEDGNTTYTINPDGSTVAATVSGNVTSSTTILADGTEIVAEVNLNGNSSSFTTYPDGSTLDLVEANNGRVDSFHTLADGTTIDYGESPSGNTNSVTVSPDGTVQTEIVRNNGAERDSTVNPDGSSYSFARRTNGKVIIENIDSSGNSVREVYLPWRTYYTVTTTPPGTSENFSPNPYQT